MGGAKDLIDALGALRVKARKVLRDAGVLQQCEAHGLWYDADNADVQEAYKLANVRISSGVIDLGDWRRRDFTDAIKHEFEENGGLDYCSLCAENEAD